MRLSTGFLMALALTPAASASDAVLEWPVTLQLDVNTAGQVTSAKVMDPVPLMQPAGDDLAAQKPRFGPLPDALVPIVEKATLKWRFQPIRVQGIPVTGRTWAVAELHFAKRNGNVDVSIQYVRNGPFMRYPVMPKYPELMVRQDISGALAVEYVVEPDGSTDQIRILKAFGGAAEHEDLFGQAVRTALSESKSIPLMVDGKAVATRMRVPYVFHTDDGMPDFDSDRLLKKALNAINLESRSDSSEASMEAGWSVAVNSPFVLPPG